MSELIELESHGRVLRVAMNRPDKRNALSSKLCRELVDAFNHANHDLNVGAIVLAANGPAFCAGMDLHEVGHIDSDSLSHLHDQLFTIGSRLTKPLVAAVDGPALGGGLGLAANGHIVVASLRARFGLTEIRIGLWPFLVYRAVENALGARRTLELALTGRIFETAEAQAITLVQVIDEDPNGKAMEIAAHLAAASPTAIRSGLNYVQETRGQNWEMAGMVGRYAREELFQSADFQEGLRAFREKRQPEWPSLAQVNQYPGDKTP
ncbi:MAG TPA: enoyl-CoA hydratase-related protein [Candidatus Sulfopaludibacter sp.]|nr:enoyl-CoA hydratase-related protein [Candidatus Sulfopaludibacter sp.]